MNKGAPLRWTVLLAALTATLAAIFWPVVDATDAGVSGPARHGARQAPRAVAPLIDAAAAQGDADGGEADPFAPRGWQAPPPPAPTAPAAPLVVAPVDLTPPGPPPLPYRFVGGLNDSAEHVVYLARGEQTYIGRVGEVLEGTYKVIDVSPTQIEFEHLPTGAKQALVFPAHDN